MFATIRHPYRAMEEKWTRRIVAVFVVGSAISKFGVEPISMTASTQEIIVLAAMIAGSFYLLWSLWSEIRASYTRRQKEQENRQHTQEHEQAKQREEQRMALIHQLIRVRSEMDECEGHVLADWWRTSENMMILREMLHDHGHFYLSDDASFDQWSTYIQQLIVLAKTKKLRLKSK